MIELFFYLAIALNSIAVVFFFLYAYRQKGRLFNIATFSVLLGTISLGVMLLISGLATSRHPATGSFQSFNFMGFLILFIYFIAEYKFKIRMLGTFLPTFALFFNILSLITPERAFPIEGFSLPALFSIHTAFALLGEAVFALAFVASLLYLVQERYLKTKRFGDLFFKLPSLATLEKAASFSLLFGLPFLTVGLLLGFLLAAENLGENWFFDPKIIGTLITWIVYSIVFVKRVKGTLRGKKFALFCVVGFFFVVACYWAASYLSSFHNFITTSGAVS